MGEAMFKCPSYADDMTLYESLSIKKAYFHVHLFQKTLKLILDENKNQRLNDMTHRLSKPPLFKMKQRQFKPIEHSYRWIELL